MPQTASNIYYISQVRRLFYCDIKIKIPATFSDDVLDEGFALMEYIDRIYNSYQPGSYISRVNKNAGEWVETDAVTTSTLKIVKAVSQLTDRAYDITAMPLLKLWGFYNSGGAALPNKAEIELALSGVNYNSIQTDGNKVKISKNQQIISGSFAKAMAVDVLISYLKGQGVTDAIINAGGSTIAAIGNTESNWSVNLPHPFIDGTKTAAIPLNNCCFSMSGSRNNFIEIDGKRYSHIINAKTGWPSANVQTGVLSKSALVSDILSTALFALNEKDFQPVVKSLKKLHDFDAYLITSEGSILTTGYNAFNAISL